MLNGTHQEQRRRPLCALQPRRGAAAQRRHRPRGTRAARRDLRPGRARRRHRRSAQPARQGQRGPRLRRAAGQPARGRAQLSCERVRLDEHACRTRRCSASAGPLRAEGAQAGARALDRARGTATPATPPCSKPASPCPMPAPNWVPTARRSTATPRRIGRVRARRHGKLDESIAAIRCRQAARPACSNATPAKRWAGSGTSASCPRCRTPATWRRCWRSTNSRKRSRTTATCSSSAAT